MTVRVRFMVIQTLSFGFWTQSIHLFDWDPHERPNPSAQSNMLSCAVPQSVLGQCSFVFTGTLMQRETVNLRLFDVKEGESRCSGELTGCLEFPTTMIVPRFSLFLSLPLSLRPSVFGGAGGNERSEGGMKCRR